MKYIKGFLGFIMMLFGIMLIAITIDDELIKNSLLRIVGAFFIFFGTDTLHRQFHPDKYKKDLGSN
ncbi:MULTISPECIES: hypothetical protein [unclassified Lysinibacillus]|uniref:hypothetical protein n=1 Tax=unclassified Lysinibacillus TaxID=2636778 RepID=UPI0038106A4D